MLGLFVRATLQPCVVLEFELSWHFWHVLAVLQASNHAVSCRPVVLTCCACSVAVVVPAVRIHNEAVAMARLSAEHHQYSSRGLKGGGSMNSNHSQQSHHSADGLHAANGVHGPPAAVPKAV